MVEPRIVTPKNQVRILEIAPIISECCFLYRAWGFSGDSITDVIMSDKDNFLPKFVVLSMTETAYQILKEMNYV